MPAAPTWARCAMRSSAWGRRPGHAAPACAGAGGAVAATGGAADGHLPGHAAAVRAFRGSRRGDTRADSRGSAQAGASVWHPRAAHGLEPPAAAARIAAAAGRAGARQRLLRAQLCRATQYPHRRRLRPRWPVHCGGGAGALLRRAVPPRALGRNRFADAAQLP
ncbi:hypothetical protein G6F68_012473 [Rhizopus microsporus]|nr:hypothetical protein G6F68_012473 [Rhizopus microsporus]